jgi:hypothetical protein
MISDASLAKQISDLMLEVDRRLESSMELVEQRCTPEEYAAYKKAVGKVISRIVFDVIEPLYAMHPALQPPNWND